MSAEEVRLLVEKIDDLAGRVTSLEELVTTLMASTAMHDKVLRWLRTAGLVLLGVAIGSGVVKLDDAVALLGAP